MRADTAQPDPGHDPVVADIRRRAVEAQDIVFVSGNFNVVHPGHLRLLSFAKDCGDFLVVGVNRDHDRDTVVPEQLRLEAVQAIGFVDHAFLLDGPVEELIERLRPAVVVKGKEHERRSNPEQAAVESYGGKLQFGSGEVRFSSLDLLQRELHETNFSTIRKPLDYPARHGFHLRELAPVIDRFRALEMVVVGDLIVDEYITCDPIGMSQEDPTIVVTPLRTDRFVGGAGIVAAHARGLGASVRYFGVAGRDEIAHYAEGTLRGQGVDCLFLLDDSRPTTLKQRFRASGKTLLRVSHLRQHDISQELSDRLYERILPALEHADILVFSDFNYGCLPQALVERLVAACERNGIMMVADSQASSQMGDVSRFRGMHLIKPTEREARLAMHDFSSGLVVLAEGLRRKADARHVLLTLGAEGLLIHSPGGIGHGQVVTDRLPAFNTAPKDVSGAGDCMMTCSAMALASGADIWQAAYLGAVAAACQVSRVGNTPLSAEELLLELSL
jgi:rfaE bifunctional protein kinase chain/domain